jgi:transposase
MNADINGWLRASGAVFQRTHAKHSQRAPGPELGKKFESSGSPCMNESTSRKSYDDDFKRNAVKQFNEHRRNLTESAAELGITPAMLHKWVKKYSLSENQPESRGQDERVEIDALRREVRALKEDVVELKKIVSRAFLARFNAEAIEETAEKQRSLMTMLSLKRGQPQAGADGDDY